MNHADRDYLESIGARESRAGEELILAMLYVMVLVVAGLFFFHEEVIRVFN